MPRTEYQNEKIREATRATIVASAMTLFAQNGYAHTTIRAIAGRAGVSTGLMYHYFDSKDALLQAVFQDCTAILNQTFTEAYEQSQPWQRVSSILGEMFTLLENDTDFWSLFYTLRGQPAVMALLGPSFRLYTERLRRLFTFELKSMGRQQPDVDALVLYSLIEGTIQQYLLDPDNYPLATVFNRIIEEFGS